MRSALAWGLAALVGLLWAGRADGVVCADDDPMPRPSNGWVGWWNGSSAVAIAPNWIVTARHVGGTVGGYFWMRGVPYRAVEIRQHPTQDIALVRVAETLPGHHRIAQSVQAGDLCVLGGYGATAGNPVAGGYDWSGAQEETWGANTIENAGTLFSIEFNDPGSEDAVPHEALFAIHDSGAGLFVYGGDGSLELAGVAVSVTGWGSTVYGNMAFAVSAIALSSWILPIADPERPVTSSTVAPRAAMFEGGILSTIWGAAVGLGVWNARRRRSR